MNWWSVFIWAFNVWVWWYLFCTFMYIHHLKKSIKVITEGTQMLESMPYDATHEDVLHAFDIISANQRVSNMHYENAMKWDKRGNLLNYMRRKK
jgi:hypothetical protein